MKAPRAWPAAISGLVVTLSQDVSLAEKAVSLMRSHPDLTVGHVVDQWVPVSLESEDPRSLHQWMEGLPGVQFLDVVFVGHPEDPAVASVSTPMLNPA